MSERAVFRLFIAGDTPQSRNAVATLRRIGETELAGNCQLEIIDVLEDPWAAEREKVLATPALIKLAPPPARRLVGDMADIPGLLWTLDIGIPAAEGADRGASRRSRGTT